MAGALSVTRADGGRAGVVPAGDGWCVTMRLAARPITGASWCPATATSSNRGRSSARNSRTAFGRTRSAVLDGEICCLEPDGRTDFFASCCSGATGRTFTRSLCSQSTVAIFARVAATRRQALHSRASCRASNHGCDSLEHIAFRDADPVPRGVQARPRGYCREVVARHVPDGRPFDVRADN
jgi:hypothetical protein